jgi:pimeloyl-ACP methyl ester carboxylesterase
MKVRIWILALIFLLVIATGVTIKYRQWVRATEIRLGSGSQVAQTYSGAVEYASMGDGPAVMVLHGLKGGYDQGLVTANLLNAPNYRFITVSRPGYLRTPLDTGRTPAEQADALAALLDSLGIRKAAVLAQSIGGPYALQFALRHPDRCWGVVLISAITMPKVEQPPSFMERLLSLLVDSDFGNWLMIAMADRWPDQMIPLLITNPEHLDMVMNDSAKLGSIIEGAQSLALASQRRAGSDNDVYQITHMEELPLDEITAPTLVIAGTGGDLTEDAVYIAERNPEVQLVLVEDGDHSTFTVFSDELVPRVLEFLDSNAPAQYTHWRGRH